LHKPIAECRVGWEQRGGRSYYSQAERVGGRVVKRYVGGGRIGVLAAQLEAIERSEKETDRELRRSERDEIEALDGPLAELNELADLLAHAALLAAGLRQHHRGEWRKPRARADQAD
jgi:hypothetical protein